MSAEIVRKLLENKKKVLFESQEIPNEKKIDSEEGIEEGVWRGTRAIRNTAEKVLRNHGLNNSTGMYDKFVNRMWSLYKETLLDLDELETVMEREFKKMYPNLKESEDSEITRCVCGSFDIVEEGDDLVCNDCGRIQSKGISESEDIEVSNEEIEEDAELEVVEEPEEDNLGANIIRAVQEPISTAKKPSLDSAIMEALSKSKVKESVDVDTGKWKFNTGRAQPSGRGIWWFKIGDEEISFSGMYSDAKRQAISRAKMKKVSKVILLP